jgi:hypothetical protein
MNKLPKVFKTGNTLYQDLAVQINDGEDDPENKGLIDIWILGGEGVSLTEEKAHALREALTAILFGRSSSLRGFQSPKK